MAGIVDSRASSSSSLAPGFRFHPTDEELVRYYLRRKVSGKPLRVDAISLIDIYKAEPWDLPDKSRLKTRDLEWYFFSVLDKKYGNGSKTNRATERGYWKTTGKDRAVYHRSQIVGMKKTLVYHSGRAPRGERTNWVMHEYRLNDEALEKAGTVQDAFVLCRVFQKSGSGPKNGEQYGAPFIDEEWEEDEVDMVPKEADAEEVLVGEDAYLDGADLEQILGTSLPSEDAPLPFNFYCGDNSSYVEEPRDFADDAQTLLAGVGQTLCSLEQPDDQKLFDLPLQYDADSKPVKHEYIDESRKTINPLDVDYLLDEPFLDASDTPKFDDGIYLETNDLSSTAGADLLAFDFLGDYLTYFDADGDNLQSYGFDSSNMMEIENLVPVQAALTQEVNEGTQQKANQQVNGGRSQQVATSSQELLGEHSNNVASSSKQELTKSGSDFQHSFVKQANHMLDSIPAPYAFATEFPTKGATALHLNSVSESSSSIHVTAGMVQIRNTTLNVSGADWSLGKHNINVVLAFNLSRGDGNTAIVGPLVSMTSGNDCSTLSWIWFYLAFIWVLIVSLSFKIGTCVYAR